MDGEKMLSACFLYQHDRGGSERLYGLPVSLFVSISLRIAVGSVSTTRRSGLILTQGSFSDASRAATKASAFSGVMISGVGLLKQRDYSRRR